MSELMKLAKKPMTETQLLIAQAVNEMTHAALTQSALLERIAGNVANHVVEFGTVLIGVGGSVDRTFQVPLGTVVIFNYGAAEMQFAVGGSGAASSSGIGVGIAPIPALTWCAIPCAAHAFTIFGTAGQRVQYQAYTSMWVGAGRLA